jgi:hypothetical protein
MQIISAVFAVSVIRKDFGKIVRIDLHPKGRKDNNRKNPFEYQSG